MLLDAIPQASTDDDRGGRPTLGPPPIGAPVVVEWPMT
jgi:hypothetical protein